MIGVPGVFAGALFSSEMGNVFVFSRGRATRSVLAAVATTVIVAAIGCVIDVPLDDKRCDIVHPCVDGFTCVAEVCVPTYRLVDEKGQDDAGAPAGQARDAGPDVGEDAGPGPDAGPTPDNQDAGPDCLPGIELCGNGADEDCDLQVDEGCFDCIDDETFPGAFFSVCQGPLDWAAARAACQERNLDLAILADADFADAVIAAVGSEQLWLGLDDTFEEGRFLWVDGSATSFEDFLPGEPNDSDGEDCVETMSHGWNDEACSEEQGFVCALPPPPRSPLSCDDENADDDQDGTACIDDCDDANPRARPGLAEDCFDRADNDCDGVVDERCAACDDLGGGALVCGRRTTGDDARARCADIGRRLGRIDSQALQDDIEGVIVDRGYDRCWIGLNDRAAEGTYAWDDGSALDGLVLFEPGQPDDDPSEDCINMRDDRTAPAPDVGPDDVPDGVYGWGDSSCGDRFDAYLCTP